MSNTIRIKRRLNEFGALSGAPSELYNAELAFNEVDNTLYYGEGQDANGMATSIIPIGGNGYITSLVSGVSSTLNTNIGNLRTEVGTVSTTLNNSITSLHTEVGTVSTTLNDSITSLRSDVQTASGQLHSDITSLHDSLSTAAFRAAGNNAGQLPILDAQGKLAISTLPGLAITDTHVVADETAMLGLTGVQVGDVAIVTSTSKTYILAVEDPTDVNHWKEILTPIATAIEGLSSAVTTFVDGVSSTLEAQLTSYNYDLTTALQTTSGALADRISTLRTDVGTASGALAQDISTLRTDVGTVSGALADRISTLRTDVGTASGALADRISTLRTDVGTASGALADRISTLRTDVGTVSSTLNNSITANDQAINSRVTSLSSAAHAEIVALSGDMVNRDALVLSGAKAYADQLITDLVGGAPALLNTLSELASAINDDSNYFVHVAEKITALSGANTGSNNRISALETNFGTLTATSGVTVLGTIASQNYDSVSITGGTISVSSLTATSINNATLFNCVMDAGTF